LTQTAGPPEAGFGLWWSRYESAQDLLAYPDFERSFTVVAINGNGYLGVWRSDGERMTFIQDWMIFPWVRPPGEANQIRVDWMGETARVWINDETALEFEEEAGGYVRIGFLAITQDVGGSVVELDRLRQWGQGIDR
jgi:hypothetical protein